MQQLMRALAALGAALVFAGCGGQGETRYATQLEEDGTPVAVECTTPEGVELQYTDRPGYNPGGCMRDDRMANVAVGPFEGAGEEETTADETDDIGSAKQAISFGVVTGLPISVDGQGDFNDLNAGSRCPADVNWTTNQPLLGNCMEPGHIEDATWAVCPSCYTTGNWNYMRERFAFAWDLFKKRVDCPGGSFTPAFRAQGENTSSSNPNDNFATARIVLWPQDDPQPDPQHPFTARTWVSDALAQPRTPIRNGIRYWTWDYIGITISHSIIEGVRQDACTDPHDTASLRAAKLKHAYEYVIAHELGHVFGIPHLTTGLMKRGSATTCSEIFSTRFLTTRQSELGLDTLGAIARLRNSSGVNIINDGQALACPPQQFVSSSTNEDKFEFDVNL